MTTYSILRVVLYGAGLRPFETGSSHPGSVGRDKTEQARCGCAGCARLWRTFPDDGAMTTDEQETRPYGPVSVTRGSLSLEQVRRRGPLATETHDFRRAFPVRDACRIQTCDLLIRSQMLYSAELRRHSGPIGTLCLSSYSAVSFATNFFSWILAFLPESLRR